MHTNLVVSSKHEEQDELDVLILDSIGRTMGGLMALADCQTTVRRVVLEDLVIEFELSTFMVWHERLAKLWDVAFEIHERVNMDLAQSLALVMRADGWVIAEGTVKTPAWMSDGVEMSVGRLKSLGYEVHE